MAINLDEDTEFNDALRRCGIFPPKESPPSLSPPPSPSLEDVLNEFDLPELRELSEDAPDADTERFIEKYRRQRIADAKKEQRRARFGRVYPIGREDYTREVTEASNVDEDGDDDGKGTGVICFLYKDGVSRSDRAFQHIHALAQRYPRTKFVSIVGNKCIPDLPDSRVPMILAYRKGEIKQQLVAWGADRERHIEELEAILLLTGALDAPQRPEFGRRDRDVDDNSGDDDDDDPSSFRSAATSKNARSRRNIRSSARKQDDSDSEFEFDV